MPRGNQLPPPDPMEPHTSALCSTFAATSWLPHPEVVRAVGSAVFPTSRARRLHPRFERLFTNGAAVGMYDDNTTPAWALLWAHGIFTGARTGWAFAHVWTAADDVSCYTHLANLVMVPECLASVTDKKGPLAAYLQWHAWAVYGWKPSHVDPPPMPADYGGVLWRYLPRTDDPKQLIAQRIAQLNNERVRILRPIMRGWISADQ